MLMKCHETRKNGQTLYSAAFDNARISDFYFSHGGGLVEITEFVFHCVNLRGAGDVSMCIIVVRGAGDVSMCIIFVRGAGDVSMALFLLVLDMSPCALFLYVVLDMSPCALFLYVVL